MVTREWARDAEDILWRRSKLGLLFTETEVAKLTACLEAKQPDPSQPV
jgi:glycerol-3-phosphate dehydrogenase